MTKVRRDYVHLEMGASLIEYFLAGGSNGDHVVRADHRIGSVQGSGLNGTFGNDSEARELSKRPTWWHAQDTLMELGDICSGRSKVRKV